MGLVLRLPKEVGNFLLRVSLCCGGHGWDDAGNTGKLEGSSSF